MTEFPIRIETDETGITLRQVGTATFSIGNGERCDMVFISDDDILAVIIALRRRMNEINERNSL
jgi:threonine dehydratase